jgi:hypothetical protein
MKGPEAPVSVMVMVRLELRWAVGRDADAGLRDTGTKGPLVVPLTGAEVRRVPWTALGLCLSMAARCWWPDLHGHLRYRNMAFLPW